MLGYRHRALIRQLVAAEDTKSPLSDSRISQFSANRVSWWRGERLQSTRVLADPACQPQKIPVCQISQARRRPGPERQRPSPRYITRQCAPRSAAKLDRVTRHFDHRDRAHVILSVDKLNQKAEITLHVRGKDIHAECIDADLYAAIDLLVDKLTAR